MARLHWDWMARVLFSEVGASRAPPSLWQSPVLGLPWRLWVRSSCALLHRIADPDQPVLWLDQMPAPSLSRGFNNHINLIRWEPSYFVPVCIGVESYEGTWWPCWGHTQGSSAPAQGEPRPLKGGLTNAVLGCQFSRSHQTAEEVIRWRIPHSP